MAMVMSMDMIRAAILMPPLMIIMLAILVMALPISASAAAGMINFIIPDMAFTFLIAAADGTRCAIIIAAIGRVSGRDMAVAMTAVDKVPDEPI